MKYVWGGSGILSSPDPFLRTHFVRAQHYGGGATLLLNAAHAQNVYANVYVYNLCFGTNVYVNMHVYNLHFGTSCDLQIQSTHEQSWDHTPSNVTMERRYLLH